MGKKVDIILDNKNITDKIESWNIVSKKGILEIKITYLSGKKYYANFERCKIKPTKRLKKNQFVLLKGVMQKDIKDAKILGEKYLIAYYGNKTNPYIFKMENLEIVESVNNDHKDILNYFKKIAKLKDQKGMMKRKISEDLKSLIIGENTVLASYLKGENSIKEIPRSIIYPFGLNQSQMKAIERALSSKISIIEGPPGTGKTQTILNIIANVVVEGKSVAVVSNNDSAVKNVFEKLDKYGLGGIVAQLGSSDKIQSFFENYKKLNNINKDNEACIEYLHNLKNDCDQIKDVLELNNRVAMLKDEVRELEIEREYLKKWVNEDMGVELKKLKFLKNKSYDIVELLSLLEIIPEDKISIFRKFYLFAFYGIYDFKSIDRIEIREKIVSNLQVEFYDKRIVERKKEINDINNKLLKLKHKELENRIVDNSMSYFKIWLDTNLKDGDFNKKNYKFKLNEFLNRFPIIISTAYSIIGSIGSGNIVDYLIIAEASQLEIVPGMLAFGVARNAIIVGDRKQLAHIPIENKIVCPNEKYDYDKNSILDSVHKVFKDNIPVTLLREHYRCHPMIINYCNKEFYNDELIPMTKYTDEEVLIRISTVKGNHMRFAEKGMLNAREIESLFEEGINNKILNSRNIGFISPYRAQINEAEKFLDKETIVKDTVHKFQGRECDTVILSTVLDKKASKRTLNFVDEARLINVAVSRAKNKFVLVTGENIFEKNKKHIDSLIRYMKYYTKESLIYKSKVVSNFDLLYKEYDESLEKRKKKLRYSDSRFKSEIIIASVIRDILQKEEFSSIIVHQQVRLNLIVGDVDGLTDEEIAFIKRKSSCDFVIYYKVGNNPIGVIEVDGYKFHNNIEQKNRDELKDSIINKTGLGMCRVATNESGEEKKIEAFLGVY